MTPQARYRDNHPERVKEQRRLYRINNPKKKQASEKRRRQRAGYVDRNKVVRRESPIGWARRTLIEIRSRSKKRGRLDECLISTTDIVSAYPKNGVCPVRGVVLEIGHKDNSPSVDRFDSAQWYTPTNIRVISIRANLLKNNATLMELRQLVRYMERDQ